MRIRTKLRIPAWLSVLGGLAVVLAFAVALQPTPVDAMPGGHCMNQELQITRSGTGITCGGADADAKGNALDAAAATCFPDGLCGDCYFTQASECEEVSPGNYISSWTYHYRCYISLP